GASEERPDAGPADNPGQRRRDPARHLAGDLPARASGRAAPPRSDPDPDRRGGGDEMSSPGVPFGQTPDGDAARLYTLESDSLRVRITDYGGRVVSLEMREPEGGWFDVLLGFDNAAEYAKAGGTFGA